MSHFHQVQLRKSDKVLLGIVIFIFLVYCIGTFCLGSATFVDVLRGYVSMEQFLDGESFNTLNYNLATEKVSYFVAWWTPGQYILPYVLKSLGLSLQGAQGVLITFFLGVSIIGYLRLFRFFRFSPTISLLSILLILTNHLFFWNSLMYFGGSLFELAFLPWFLLLLLQIKSFTIKTGLKYFVLALFLFFLKATFLMHVGIGLGALLLGYNAFQKKELVIMVLTGIAILAVCYFSFLQYGETPSSAVDNGMYNSIPNNIFNDLFTPFASIVGIPFAIGTFVQKILPYYSWVGYVGVGIMALLSVLGGYVLYQNSKESESKKRLVFFAILLLSCFIVFFLANKAISYDFRHFAPLAFVFVPFILTEVKRFVQSDILLKIGVGFLVLLNLFFFSFKRWQITHETRMLGEHSFLKEDSSILNYYEGNLSLNADENQRVVLVNNWELMPYFSTKEVLPVYSNDGKWFLKSGMELDNPKKIDLGKELLNDSNLVVIVPHGNAEEIKSYLNEEKFDGIVIGSSGYGVLFSRSR